MKPHRLKAFFLRHLYPLQRDFDLLSDMIYWPLVDTILWGVTGAWLVDTSGVPGLIVAILTSLVLWNVIWRSQSEIGRNMMDEIWNNNLVNLFSTPLSIREWTIGVLLLSFFKMSVTLTIIIPVMFFLYHVNVLLIGPWLPVFFVIATIMGWSVGFLSAGIVLRWGPKVQTVIWTLPGMLLPFSAVFFPLDKLPAFAQVISRFVPTTYAFEAMRSLLLTGQVPVDYLVLSFALDVVLLAITIVFFLRSFEYSRMLGLNRFD